MSIIVVNALGIHVAALVFMCPSIFLLLVESLSMLVDVVTTVGHHLDGGVWGVSPYQGGKEESDRTHQRLGSVAVRSVIKSGESKALLCSD